MLLPVGLGLFTAPSTIVPSYHRLKSSICKLFKPLASLSYATWSSVTFLLAEESLELAEIYIRWWFLLSESH